MMNFHSGLPGQCGSLSFDATCERFIRFLRVH